MVLETNNYRHALVSMLAWSLIYKKFKSIKAITIARVNAKAVVRTW